MSSEIKWPDAAGDETIDGIHKHRTAVRVPKCRDDGSLQSYAECRVWLEQFSLFARSLLGDAPRIQVYAYGHDGGSLLAVDADSSDRRTSLSLTIDLCGAGIELELPLCDQIVIAVPGIVDAWTVLGNLCHATHGGIVTKRVSSDYALCVAASSSPA